MHKPPSHHAPASRAQQLRALLDSPRLEFIMEAHNGLSAQIVERAGFKGIWASSLACSAQFGVRDSNEASWTQVVEMLEFMSDTAQIPILLDGDTGYGNFNNLRRLIGKIEQRNIAGVCIEDKIFPKINSYVQGEQQPLASIDEFSGKIKAAKDCQHNEAFCVIARIEALIAGWGMEEALRRAEAYHRAGADAILIHSKKNNASEILEFAGAWGNRLPLVIVPTTYYSTPIEVFEKAGISLVVWANHMIRASAKAMETVAKAVQSSHSIATVEDQITSVAHLFELGEMAELTEAQNRYLKRAHSNTTAIVLAADRGAQLPEELTCQQPKSMISIQGVPLLRRLVNELKRQEIHDIHVIAGYKAEAIKINGVHVITNPKHQLTGELVSLSCAEKAMGKDTLILYGDLLFRGYILRDLLEVKGDIVVVVDSAWQGHQKSGGQDLAYCSKADDRSLFSETVLLQQISEQCTHGNATPSGRWIGMVRFRESGIVWLQEAMASLSRGASYSNMTMPDLLNHLISIGKPIQVHYISGHWLDLNTLPDLQRANDFLQGVMMHD